MNKQHFDSLYKYALKRTPVDYHGIYLYNGFYTFMSPVFIVFCAEKPVGHDIETDVLPFERLIQDIENKIPWKKSLKLEPHFFKCSLSGDSMEATKIADGYWVNKKLAYRIDLVINLREIKIPFREHKPCLLIGKNGYAYLMPCRAGLARRKGESHA